MKKIKFQLFLLFGLAFQAINAQQIAYNFGLRFRDQDIKQYTSIFVSSPVANQMLGAVTGPYQSGEGVNTNRYWQFVNGAYQLITVLNASTTPMVPGRGYVIQRGGIGVPPGDPTALFSICHQDYNSGGATNIIDTPVQIIGGMFNLIGNPYLGYLDVDAFLLDPANVNLVTGPLRLWAHNTIVSSGNPPDPNNPDTSTYTNSANDFALYNVLGGVAAGRYISTSNENETFTGVQTPNGKLGFGTGFLIAGLASGNAVFKPSMSSATDNGGENQSYRGILANTNTHERTENSEPTPNTTPQALALPTKNRLWVNIEKGIPPTSGINYNQLKQLLVGYIEGATIADNDRVYDAETVTVQPKIEFYSLAPISTGSTKHLAIQGRGNSDFFGSDYFQLGYTVTESGDYTWQIQ